MYFLLWRRWIGRDAGMFTQVWYARDCSPFLSVYFFLGDFKATSCMHPYVFGAWLLCSWILLASALPLVGELTEQNVAEYQQQQKPIGKLFMNFAQFGQDRVKRYERRLIDAARQFPSILFVIVDFGIQFWSQEPVRFGIVGRKVAFVIDSPPLKFVLPLKPTARNITQFCTNVSQRTVEPFYKTAPVPPDALAVEDGVHVVVSTTFHALILDAARHSVVMFYAPWCGHCTALAPVYAQVAARFPRDTFVFGKMDLTANDCPVPYTFPFRAYPTIYVAPMHSKASPTMYEGVRDLEALVAWVTRHTRSVPEVAGARPEALPDKSKKRGERSRRSKPKVAGAGVAQPGTAAEAAAAGRASHRDGASQPPPAPEPQSVGGAQPAVQVIADEDMQAPEASGHSHMERLGQTLESHTDDGMPEGSAGDTPLSPAAPSAHAACPAACANVQQLSTAFERELRTMRLRLLKLESLMKNMTAAACGQRGP